MTGLIEFVSRLEQSGGRLVLDGDRIRYCVPRGNPEAQGFLAELRKHREEVTELLRQRAADGRNWPPESLDYEQRFGQPHGRLFAFIGRKMRTPAGPGTLIQVFADRCTVLLDSQVSQCAGFAPGEIEPVSWSL